METDGVSSGSAGRRMGLRDNSDIAIADLSALIAEIVGYEGGFSFDTSRPDGTARKLLDASKTKS